MRSEQEDEVIDLNILPPITPNLIPQANPYMHDENRRAHANSR